MKNNKNALLWSIISADGERKSYLFGTMHVRDEIAFKGLTKAFFALEKCKVFATEFDFNDVDQTAIETAMTLPNNTTIQGLLSKKAGKNLEFFCQKHFKSSAEIFTNKHPMAVSSILSQTMLAEDMPLSLDETLWKKALELDKTCTGVETFEEQIAVIGKIPLETHVKGLQSLLKNIGNFRRKINKMSLAYQKGDIEYLYKSAKKDAKGMRQILLYQRNHIMAERMDKIMQTDTLFCAVGAGHLAGGKGVLLLLKKKGYRVEKCG